jgi:hypothetical protein
MLPRKEPGPVSEIVYPTRNPGTGPGTGRRSGMSANEFHLGGFFSVSFGIEGRW